MVNVAVFDHMAAGRQIFRVPAPDADAGSSEVKNVARVYDVLLTPIHRNAYPAGIADRTSQNSDIFAASHQQHLSGRIGKIKIHQPHV